jgi:alkylation response protein AidB-like acyl-CoA dehydrogenase
MQEDFRDAAIAWLTDAMPLQQARARPASIWQGMATMGLLNLTAPDMDAGHATEALIFAELGRFLSPVAAISTAFAARWVGTTGKVALAIPAGNRLRILDPEGCLGAIGQWGKQAGTAVLPDHLILTPSLDPGTAQMVLDPGPKPVLSDDPRAACHLQLLAAAYALGTADAARDMACAYALVREQFGKAIGSFQAIKHMCADMAVRTAVARSQLYFAACALDENAADAAYHSAVAKRLCDSAALDNARANIQVHGGIGMTDEAAPHLCLKRAHLLTFVAPVATADLLAAWPD